jgi:hypothetical protein
MKKYIYLIQCAWILWGNVGTSWFIVEGKKTLEQCEDLKSMRLVTRPPEEFVNFDTSSFASEKGQGRYVCLPDTVDPRKR